MPGVEKKKASKTRAYSPKAGEKVAEVMREFKRGELKGGAGRHPKVKNRKQAIAIGLSEARKEGARVPPVAAHRRSK